MKFSCCDENAILYDTLDDAVESHLTGGAALDFSASPRLEVFAYADTGERDPENDTAISASTWVRENHPEWIPS